jgi:5-methylcytosine-specific restriction endonuclease McrA
LGRKTICKQCEAITSAKYREEHHVELIVSHREYYKSHKEEIAKYCYDHKEQMSERGKKNYLKHKVGIAVRKREYAHAHKEQISEWGKNYYLVHTEEIAKRRKQYRQSERGRLLIRCNNQRRRARKVEAMMEGKDITPEEFQRIVNNQKHRCNMCGKKLCKSRPATIDHIVPLSKRGKHISLNIQALCGSCNSSKNAKIMKCFINSWMEFP